MRQHVRVRNYLQKITNYMYWFFSLLLLLSCVPTLQVSAATSPTPPNFLLTPLPTVQVEDGIIWAQVIVGDTVYATGCYHTVTDVAGAVGTVKRKNMLAYSLSTRKLASTFNHSLTGDNSSTSCHQNDRPASGLALAASSDGTKLFVGGSFT